MMLPARRRIRRRGRDRGASRAGPIGKRQDIVAPISGSEDARAGFGRSATAHEAIPAQSTFLDGVDCIQACHSPSLGGCWHDRIEKFNTEDPPANDDGEGEVDRCAANEGRRRANLEGSRVRSHGVFRRVRVGRIWPRDSHFRRGRGKHRRDVGAEQATIIQDGHVKVVALIRFDNPIAVTAAERDGTGSKDETWPLRSDTYPRSWCYQSVIMTGNGPIALQLWAGSTMVAE